MAIIAIKRAQWHGTPRCSRQATWSVLAAARAAGTHGVPARAHAVMESPVLPKVAGAWVPATLRCSQRVTSTCVAGAHGVPTTTHAAVESLIPSRVARAHGMPVTAHKAMEQPILLTTR
jgi:hypothetical protein